MKRILLVDNYDSFTYNLVHYLEGLDCAVTVCYNDCIPANVLNTFDGVVLSPGPGLPSQSGELKSFIHSTIGKIPMLGVCLGMQAIAEELNGTLYNQQTVKHGLQEFISVKKGVLFNMSNSQFQVGLYHSWAVSPEGDYDVVAETSNGTVMAIENKSLRCYGVQFHPESIMTPEGKEVLRNFLKVIGEPIGISLV